MSGHGLLTLPEMKRPDPAWPRRIVRDIAYLFIPFAFVAFLLILGGALLITWGRLTNSVLVGFCVTAGLLIGFFVICHLALYCTWAKKEESDMKKHRDRNSSETGSVGLARSVKLGDPIVCPTCLSGIKSPATNFEAMRINPEVSNDVSYLSPLGLTRWN